MLARMGFTADQQTTQCRRSHHQQRVLKGSGRYSAGPGTQVPLCLPAPPGAQGDATPAFRLLVKRELDPLPLFLGIWILEVADEILQDNRFESVVTVHGVSERMSCAVHITEVNMITIKI